MAHECPVCYMQCHCGCDIDDLMLNHWKYVSKCTHCDEHEDEDEYFNETDLSQNEKEDYRRGAG